LPHRATAGADPAQSSALAAFDIDIERCECDGQLKVIAVIEDPVVIVRILTHLKLPARAPPRAPARSSPFMRVVEFADRWFPRPRKGWEPCNAVTRLHAGAAAAGRDPATLSITLFAAPADRDKLVPYREAGIDRVLFEVADVSHDEILRILDRNAHLVVELAA